MRSGWPLTWRPVRRGLAVAAALAAVLGLPGTALGASGDITGSVTDAVTHSPLSGIEVDVYDSNQNFVDSATTDATGAYTLSGLTPGSYEVGFSDFSNQNPHVSQYFNGKTTLNAADSVTVASGSTTGGIDAQLEPGGTISGAVTDASTHTPVGNVDVTVLDSSGNYVNGTRTDAGGRYAVGGLGSESYRVQFTPRSDSPYAQQFYSGKASQASADAVSVTGGQTTGGINAQLAAASRITGTVTAAATQQPISGVQVDVLDAGGTSVSSAYTSATGSYMIGGLAPGSYRVRFDASSAGGNYAPQFFNGKATLASADPITTTAGQASTANAALTPGGEIDGTVTDATTGHPLSGVFADVLDGAGNFVASDSSGSDGTYTVQGLATSSYRVEFFPNDNAHASVYYNGKATLATADSVAVSQSNTTTGINASLPTGASVSGTVTDATARQPAAGVAVTLLDSNGAQAGFATTAGDGTYTIGGLSAGSYRVRFADAGQTPAYTTQFYNGAASLAAATAVPLTAGQAASGIDAAMHGGGGVEGTVTDATSHQPISGVQVALSSSQGGASASFSTDSSGHYFAAGLPAGGYTVSFVDPSGGHSQQFYNGRSTPDTADTVTVTSGQTAHNIDGALSAVAHISGTVTDAPTHNPAAGVFVEIDDSTGSFAGSVTTGADGTYTVGGLVAGSYTVSFRGGAGGNYLPQYYNGKSSQGSADPVTVTAGQTRAGINAALTTGGVISGTVSDAQTGTGADGAQVTVYDSSGSYVASGLAAANGTYSIGGLAAGSYRVAFSGGGANASYISSYYNGKSTLASADPVTVTVGHTTAGINGTLQRNGAIAGTVTDGPLAAPLPGANVDVYDSGGNDVGSTQADAAGQYVVTGLAPGSYHVGFTASGYADQYFTGKPTLASANSVTVAIGQTTQNIDATMQRGGVVEGTVTGSGNVPLAGVSVEVMNVATDQILATTTDVDGSYAIGGLGPGTYGTGFFPAAGVNYLPQYYNGQSSTNNANTFSVTAGSVTQNINAQLAAGATITGHVTRASNGSAVPGISVEVVGQGTTDVTTTTDASGNYSVAALPSDSYTVEFTSPNGSYVRQDYNNKTAGNGDPIALTQGQTRSGIDAAMVAAAKIQGTVTDAATQSPLQGVQVTVYDTGGNYVASATSGANGAYLVGGLAAGGYTVGFSADSSVGNYVTQYYNGKPTQQAADTISASAGQTITGVDAALQAGGGISGTVTDAGAHQPLSDVYVQAYDSAGNFVTSAYSDASGNYTLTGLATGDYRVGFTASSGSFGQQFYNGKADLASADPVSVTAGVTTANIDQALSNGGSISGTVTDAGTHQPLSGVLVQLGLTGYFPGFAPSTTTNAQGHYTITGVPAGSNYGVEFDDAGYVTQRYSNRTPPAAGDSVTVTDGQTTTGIDAALAAGATITGTVTDASNSHPVANLTVTASAADGYPPMSATTDASGHYAIGGLATGSYTVQFGGNEPGAAYAVQYYNRKASAGSADPVSATQGQTTSGIDAGLQPSAHITGTVTNVATGDPISGIDVAAYDSGGSFLETTTTADDGTYSLDGLAAGSYRIGFASGFSGTANYASQYYSGKLDLASADAVVVATGQTVNGIDAALQSNGQVSGTVTDADTHAPVSGANVEAFDASGNFISGAITGSDGTYTVYGLGAGSYRIEFVDYGHHSAQYYNGKTTLGTADPVTVNQGTTTTGIDAALQTGGTISGIVTDASTGQPVSGITVSTQLAVNFPIPVSATTDSQGHYTLQGLDTGTYAVQFSGGDYFSQYYNGRASSSSADPVSVTSGQPTTGINVSLTPGGVITGTVTDANTRAGISGVPVSAFNAQGVLVASADTTAGGAYRISPLPSGSYRVQFNNPGSAANYVPQYYNAKSTLGGADAMSVTQGQTITGIDAALQPGGQIRGTVTDAATHAGVFIFVGAYDAAGNIVAAVATDSSTGNYTISGLPPGTYRVGFGTSFFSTNYAPQYYNGRTTLAAADTLTLSAGQVRTGIDAALQHDGQITGMVTDATTHAAAGGVTVIAYDSSGNWRTSATTDTSGTYTLSGLPSGSYSVEFTKSGAYAAQFYNGKPSLNSADPVTVTSPNTTTGIDAALQTGGSITGTVTDASTGQPATGISVGATDSSFNITTATTDSSGHYSIAGLSGGAYRVSFSGGGYIPQNYNGHPKWQSGDSVAVTFSEATPGIDAVLTRGGSLTGTVTDAGSHSGLTGVFVTASDAHGAEASASTGSDGSYTLSGLAPGTYTVAFSRSGYLTQYYNGKILSQNADQVTISGTETHTGIDAALAQAASISGTASDSSTGTPVSGISIVAYDTNGNFAGSAGTTSNGTYTITGLAPGSYRVGFSDFSSRYVSQYYNGKSTLAAADTVTLTSGQAVSQIDARLQTVSQTQGTITGTVTSAATAAKLSGISVSASQVGGGGFASTTTDANGGYTLNGLPAGTYTVAFSDGNGLHIQQYFNAKPSVAQADAVTVSGGQTTSGIDAALAAAGRITGTVSDAHFGGAISGVRVNVYDHTGAFVTSTQSDGTGSYQVAGLTPGTYAVGFDASSIGDIYGSQYYNGKDTLSSADPVAFAGESTTTGIDAHLSSLPQNVTPPTISGNAQQDRTLSEQAGTWRHSPTSFTYQWLRCDANLLSCSPIPQATSQTYTPAAADVGDRLEVQETGSNAYGTGQTATSATTAVVLPAPPVNQSVPTIGGAAQESQTLTESHGSWTHSPTSFSSQWEQCDSAGANCTPIAGATGQSYVVSSDDVGHRIVVTETASNAGGDSAPAASAATAVVVPLPPSNVGLPSITGDAVQGQTLTEQHGTWTRNPTGFSYQWQRCDSAGSNCADISGATGQAYDMTSDDVGHTILVEETAHNDGGSSIAAASPASAAVVASIPRVVNPPTISGTAQEGQTLTESHGSWTNQPQSYSYQWQRCDTAGSNCSAISGATGQTYDLTADDVGHTLIVSETAANAGGDSSPADSAATSVVVPLAPTTTTPPTITGHAVQGQTLTEHHGTWTHSPTSYSYEWLRCDAAGANCSQISGATDQTYTLISDDVGSTIEVQETATNDGGSSSPASSAPTDVVASAPPVNVSPPSVSGTAQEGKTLSAVRGDWTNQPTSYAYQWLRCDSGGQNCAPISGATNQDYSASADDVGGTLEVQETASNAGGRQPAEHVRRDVRGAARRADEHRGAENQRRCHAGANVDRAARHVDQVADRVPLPVAALRLRGRELLGDQRGDRPDVPAGGRRRRRNARGERVGEQHRRRERPGRV